jgi:hypothetical protein
MTVIPELGSLRLKERGFEARLGYVARPSLKSKIQNKTTKISNTLRVLWGLSVP